MTTLDTAGEFGGRLAGGALGGVIGGVVGGPVGAWIGRAVGSRVGAMAGKAAAAAIANMMEEANEDAERQTKDAEPENTCEDCEADDKNKQEKEASDTHDNIEQYENQDFESVEQDLDKNLRDNGWSKKPLKRGDGYRYTSPDGNRQVRLNKGYPEASSDDIHSGPYVSRPSTNTRIPLLRNPFIGM